MLLPSLFSIITLCVLEYIPGGEKEKFGFQFILLGVAYTVVRLHEICRWHNLLSPLSGAGLTTAIHVALHFCAYLQSGKTMHVVSPLSILLFFVVLFQRIRGGLVEKDDVGLL